MKNIKGGVMRLGEINPFIRYGALLSFYQRIDKNFICYDCRLFFIEEGAGYLYIGKEKCYISEGTLIFLPQKTRYHFEFQNQNEIKFYTINYDLINDYSNIVDTIGVSLEEEYDEKRLVKYFLPAEFSKPIIQNGRQDLAKMIKRCVETYRQKKLFFSQISSAQLKLILFEMLNEEQFSNNENRKVKEIIAYIELNYWDACLTNKEIANKFHYHPVYVNRLFKAYTNETLHQFIINFRLENAKELLVNSVLDITSISERVGFSSYSHFIKVFRERFGVPPKEYRKNHKYNGV